ncbi:MAG: DedA family protein [Phycisphaerae bacterium]|nr:DedA family protein [Phycisphaerae bacterium]
MTINNNSNNSSENPSISHWHLHRRLYDWVLHWADSTHAKTALFALSFAESSFFPVPPDVLLAPLTLGNRKKWWKFALNCSIASVLGAVLGYIIGHFLWYKTGTSEYTSLANFFFEHIPGFTQDKFNSMGESYEKYNFWIVFTAGFTPIPFKLITITSGVFKINPVMFIIASATSRSARFFLVSGLFARYGESIKPFIDKYFNWLCLALLALIIGGFAALKLFHH